MSSAQVPDPLEKQPMDTQRRFPHVIAITSGKGGVGKSSIAVNLGISLAKTGARVCIFDADTGLANVNILLGLMPQFSLEHVLFGAKTIEEVMLEAPHGLKVIPGANGISECVSLHPRQQLRLTRELGRIENDFDYLLLDTAAGIADTTLDFVGSAHQTMLVVTPEPTSLTDAFSLIKLMHRRRTAMRYLVVVNMCNNVAQAREVFHRFAAAVEKYIGVRPSFLGHLLRDESLRVAVTLQSPVALFPDTDPSSRSFMRLTDALKQAVDNDRPTTGFTGFWQRQFRQSHEARQNNEARQPEARQPAAKPAVAERPQPALAAATKRVQPVADAAAPAVAIVAPAPPDGAALALELQRRIDAGEIAREAAARIVADLAHAYQKRFGEPAIALSETIDALLAAPERNDAMLREVAARLQPWLPEPPPPTPELAAPASPPVAIAAPPLSVASRPLPTHRFDERRFGSQQALLELLQRQRDSGKSAMALIEIMLS